MALPNAAARPRWTVATQEVHVHFPRTLVVQKAQSNPASGVPSLRALAGKVDVESVAREHRLWKQEGLGSEFLAQGEAAEIQSLADLMAADGVLDDMYEPALRASKAYLSLTFRLGHQVFSRPPSGGLSFALSFRRAA
jgi:hypothetical protein